MNLDLFQFVFFTLALLCWGSFLNCLAYRLLHEKSIAGRSFCPHCNHTLAWYDLLPVISWLWLKGKCRYCSQKISCLYLFIEILTPIVILPLFFIYPLDIAASYTLFFSLLITSIRTDFEAMLLVRAVTIYSAPLGFFLAYVHFLPISPLESIIGGLIGYGILWLCRTLFFLFRKQEGMGIGDLELMALIGAFTGPLGAWMAILIGSTVASLIGLLLLGLKKASSQDPLPFGPFLALGAMTWVIFNTILLTHICIF